MGMTTNEAIQYWEGLRKTFSSQLEKEEKYWGRMHLQTTIDVLDTTISAIRQQETVIERHELNEPLTLDELRKMDGEPVWLVNQNGGHWVIMSGAYLWDNRKNAEYGKTWLAYRQNPEDGTA